MKSNYLHSTYFKNTDPDEDKNEDDGGKGGGGDTGGTDDTDPV